MAEVISSPSNPKIKRLLALQQKSSERRESGLFVVEGQRELQHCIDAGFEIDTLFVCPALAPGQAVTASGNRATLGIVRGRGPSSDGRSPAQQDVSGDSSLLLLQAASPAALTWSRSFQREEARVVARTGRPREAA